MSRSLIRQLLTPRMLVALMMGFACGLPLLLTGSVLQAWMREEGIDLKLIGLYALVGLPYTCKFLWAPLFDRYIPPFLGRRRGWLLMAQIALALALIGLGYSNPGQSPWLVALMAALVTFFSASQDIVVDAYRREDLQDAELGAGSSLYISGYRLGMLLAGGGGLILADHLPFSQVYLLMALLMGIGALTTLLSREPPLVEGAPKNFQESVVEPFVDYFRHDKALIILLFILLYKIGDQMASTMTMPFYLDLGFSKTEVGAVVKFFGTWAVILGGVAGAAIMLRIGTIGGLWCFGFLQAISTAGFALLALVGHSIPWLAAVIAFENLSGGMGTAAYTAYMASLTNKRFTATQYALLTSVMGVPRVIASAPTGWMAEIMGWPLFFLVCTGLALPGLFLLAVVAPRRHGQAQATVPSPD
ncbi:MAG: AmpG family muropeptide MFS transporter [bacterium]|nr:AmpG family muropeptide MFS transporter [bacterium]